MEWLDWERKARCELIGVVVISTSSIEAESNVNELISRGSTCGIPAISTWVGEIRTVPWPRC